MRQARKLAEPGEENPLSFAVSQRDRNTLDMVRTALVSNRVLLAFQPVVQAQNGGRIAFYEGLIRVLDDTGRIIPAADFMPVVENSDLGREIDCAALRCGIGAMTRKPDMRLSINMSARSIGYPKWLQILRRGLGKDPRLGERLILEITESSAMMMPEIVMTFMEDLQDKGITFALDDFGAGYTSFRYLKDFYFDIIKIDGQFIRGIAENSNNQVLTEALITIGRQFDMFTVAENVETKAEADFLVNAGIDCLQGYYYGAPETRPAWLTGPGQSAARQSA
jgi:EAL domain-containing protein (putative c-di-GMP-specific phosphodiesterase class I)